MKKGWQLSVVLASGAAMAQSVIQRSVQHFESPDFIPFVPFITFGFGVPEQNITGIFDTGSSDIIIPEAGSPLCKLERQQCDAPAKVVRGQFEPKNATDVTPLRQCFNASFGGGDQYEGAYIETAITLGENANETGQVPNAQVALATDSKAETDLPQVPVFGMGLTLLEATGKKYDNLPKKMKDAGVTKTQAYSFVANIIPSGNGSVFFGGIDRSKFEGELQEVRLERDRSGAIPEFVVKMSSVSLVPGTPRKPQGTGKEPLERVQSKVTAWKSAVRQTSARRVNNRYTRAGDGGVKKRTMVLRDGERQAAVGAGISRINNRRTRGYNGGRRREAKGGHGGQRGGRNGGKNRNNGGNRPEGQIDIVLGDDDGFTLMDSGGVEMVFPPAVLFELAGALGTRMTEDGSSLEPFKCDNLDPDATVVMRFNDDAVETRMPISHMLVPTQLADPELTSHGFCQLVVVAARRGGTSTGTLPFFAAVYTVFDPEGNRLFFAQAKGDPAAPTPPDQLEEFPVRGGEGGGGGGGGGAPPGNPEQCSGSRAA